MMGSSDPNRLQLVHAPHIRIPVDMVWLSYAQMFLGFPLVVIWAYFFERLSQQQYPTAFYLAVAALILAGILSGIILTSWKMNRSVARPAAASADDAGQRIQVFGSVRELHDLQDLTPHLTQPHVERGALLWMSGFRQSALFGLSVAVMVIVGGSVGLPFSVYLPLALFVPLWLLAAWRAIRPKLFRITPGRLELMKMHPLSGLKLLRVVNLADARVFCRFDHRALVIHPAGESRTLEFELNALEQPHRFARSVIQAALSSSTAPELPPDELTG